LGKRLLLGKAQADGFARQSTFSLELAGKKWDWRANGDPARQFTLSRKSKTKHCRSDLKKV
jgi:hypothetical protein